MRRNSGRRTGYGLSTLAGISLILYIRRMNQRVQDPRQTTEGIPESRLLEPLGKMIVVGKIEESREFRLEAELDRASGAMPLLGDDDLGASAHGRDLGLPFEEFLGARLRLPVAEIIFLSIDEHHDVGILLD